jgi:membrane protein implicated in regulation of membrane protease activity
MRARAAVVFAIWLWGKEAVRARDLLIVVPLAALGVASVLFGDRTLTIFAGWFLIAFDIVLLAWLVRRRPPTMSKEQQAEERMRMSHDYPGGGGGGGGAY